MASVLLEARPYRPFKSSEEYLEAMREDLAEWLNTMYPDLKINSDNFMDRLDTGVALCQHANNVRQAAEDYLARRLARSKSMTRSLTPGLAGPILAMGNVHYLIAAKSGTFFARDNVSNFITWCRNGLNIFECLLFETDDLIMRKNEKHVILCLLEVARRGAKFGMLAPMLVQMERQIDREIAADIKAKCVGCGTQTENGTNNISTETELEETDTEDEDDDNGPLLMYGPQPQIITNDLKSLDEMVRDLVEKCTCPSQFSMIRVSEGKYSIGETKVLIFVRILRSHVMVRVGGGWDTLSHYLDKHDPCRCRAQHRSSVAARLIPRTNQHTNGIELHKAQVIYERSPPSARRVITSSGTGSAPTSAAMSAAINGTGSPNMGGSQQQHTLSPPSRNRSRSRSPTPQRKFLNQQQNAFGSSVTGAAGQTSNAGHVNENGNIHDLHQQYGHNNSSSSPNIVRRSMSPSPRRLAEFRKKQSSLDAGLSVTANKSAVEKPTSDTIQPPIVEAIPKTDSTVNCNTETSNKFENLSDNGSEISDEGYRSLGLIQPGNGSNGQKRESIHSQTSVDDAESNGRPDQTSSDSQLSPSEESASKTPENIENTISDVLDSTTPAIAPSPHLIQPPNTDDSGFNNVIETPHQTSNNNSFEQSGVFITDDEITVDIANTTGLRKTGFSDNLYSDDPVSTFKKSLSKIPRSPVPQRRRSADASSECGSDLVQRTGLPILGRNKPVYRSVRKPTASEERKPLNAVAKGCATNTWNGRTSTPKKRPTINSDTFSSPSPSPSSGFSRNSTGRSSQIIYDKNGRRVKGSTASLTTSPVKSQASSAGSVGPSTALAQQILEAAGSAKNDAQILEKMKQLLTMYSTATNANGKGKKSSDFDDFTTAWVNSNGKLDRASSCSPPTKEPSKRSSAASSTESTHSNGVSVIVSPRRDRGISRIPAPVRQNTELY